MVILGWESFRPVTFLKDDDKDAYRGGYRISERGGGGVTDCYLNTI